MKRPVSKFNPVLSAPDDLCWWCKGQDLLQHWVVVAKRHGLEPLYLVCS